MQKMEIEKSKVYKKWYEKLKDIGAKDNIRKRLRRIQKTGNFGDVRFLGDGVLEIKIDYGPGYRLYYTMRGAKVIFLLIGADKSRQDEDINRAKEMAQIYRKRWRNGRDR